jgi:L-threonylcarbamoyladenylate synthase
MILKINKKLDNSKIERVVGVLKAGGVLVIPTETAYGLAADAGNKKAIQKIYEIKGRGGSKFLPLIVGSLKQMKEFFALGRKELELAKKYKGLTIVAKPKTQLTCLPARQTKLKKLYLAPGQKTCAVRISKYKLAREVALKLGRPITATSANRSGGENCYSVGEVTKQLGKMGNNVDSFLDGGKLKKRKPSTIVKVEGRKVEVVRQGEILIK